MNLSAPSIRPDDSDELAALCKAGGDPLRLNVLRALTNDSFGVLELAQIFAIGQSGISHHLKVLAQADLVATRRELELMKAVVDKAAQAVFADKGRTIEYLVGTMIELPRAALRAGEIAEVGEFFSFGTNDLTQTTFGLSRDDAGRFLPSYVEGGILPDDPFQTLDVEGVGQLVELATRLGRGVHADLKVGVCGEHGGDPASIEFCEQIGLDYVSCSPFRTPIARLAAAQAALRNRA